MAEVTYISETKKWVEDVVIGLNLCPFAKVPFEKKQIRYVLETGDTLDEIVKTFLSELAFLYDHPAAEIETTLIIHPNALKDFSTYNDFLGLVEELLKESGLEGIIQVASFHPDYRFAETREDDPANYTNRSPYPMLHLLREESVSRAVETYPHPENIPSVNIKRLRQIGLEGIKKLVNF